MMQRKMPTLLLLPQTTPAILLHFMSPTQPLQLQQQLT